MDLLGLVCHSSWQIFVVVNLSPWKDIAVQIGLPKQAFATKTHFVATHKIKIVKPPLIFYSTGSREDTMSRPEVLSHSAT